MSNDILTQDEVDALLKGVSGDKADETPAEAPDTVRPYNLANQERIVRERLPALELINDRFARLLRTGVYDLVRRHPQVLSGPVKILKYEEFIRNLTVPTNLNVMQVHPLRGNALFVMEPGLIYTVVDNMFGGDGRFQMRIEGRDFTATEQRIIQRILAMVCEEYRKSWAPVHPLVFEHMRSETHHQFANIVKPDEVVVVCQFSVEIGTAGGDLHFCLPYAMLEPIKDVLYGTQQGEMAAPDERWQTILTRQVQHAEVELVANLASVPTNIEQLLSMKAGDVIPIVPDERIVAEIDGVPVFSGRHGTLNGRHAIRIEKFHAIAQNDNMTGESNE